MDVPDSSKPNVKKMKEEKDIEGLIKALNYKKYWKVRERAAEALGNIGDARAVDPLIEVLKDASKYVRERAAEALGNIGDERAVEHLFRSLEDEDWDVKEAAKVALEMIKGKKT